MIVQLQVIYFLYLDAQVVMFITWIFARDTNEAKKLLFHHPMFNDL